MRKRVMVVELGASHFEIFQTHFRILERAGYEIFAFVNAKVAGKIPHGVQTETFTFGEETGGIRVAIRLLRLCRRLGVRRMVLNSANGKEARTVALLAALDPGLRIVGINHYVSKFRSSLTQRLISTKVRRYFVLSDLFFENGSVRPDENGLVVRPLYPVFFPDGPSEAVDKQGRILVVVPGEVRSDRRDYFGFLDLLSGSGSLPETLWFALLGNASTPDGRRFRERAERLGLERAFWMQDGFVDQTTFLRFLRSADLVFPLIHLDDPRYREFVHNKVSGSYAAGLGFRIPFLMHDGFRTCSDFRDVSIFYDRESLLPTLARLAADPSEIRSLKEAYSGKAKLSLESQLEVYLEVLES